MKPSKAQLLVMRRMAGGWSLWHRPGVRVGYTYLEPPPEDGVFTYFLRVAPATFAVLRDRNWIFPDDGSGNGRWQLGRTASEMLKRINP